MWAESSGQRVNSFKVSGSTKELEFACAAEAGEAEGPAADPGNISMSLAFGGQAAKRSRQFKNFIGGFEDEEIEVMGLRQENETMMDTLVRTKVELAETQGGRHSSTSRCFPTLCLCRLSTAAAMHGCL